jgi:DNA polymerase-3 subunit gamma/tau
MTGTTPPRIHLELMIARLLVERGAVNVRSASPEPAVVPVVEAPAAAMPVVDAPAPPASATPAAPRATTPPEKAPVAPPKEEAAANPATAGKPATAAEPTTAREPEAANAEGLTLSDVTDVWSDVLEDLKENPAVWVVVNVAQPVALDGDVLQIDFADKVFLERFKEKPASGNAVFEDLREALIGALGVRFRFVPRVGLGLPTTGSTPRVASQPPTADTRVEPENPFAAQAAADTAAREVSLETNPAEKAPETSPTDDEPKVGEELRGESVVRDVLGAKLVTTVDRVDAPGTRFVDSDESSESLFESPAAPDGSPAQVEPTSPEK